MRWNGREIAVAAVVAVAVGYGLCMALFGGAGVALAAHPRLRQGMAVSEVEAIAGTRKRPTSWAMTSGLNFPIGWVDGESSEQVAERFRTIHSLIAWRHSGLIFANDVSYYGRRGDERLYKAELRFAPHPLSLVILTAAVVSFVATAEAGRRYFRYTRPA